MKAMHNLIVRGKQKPKGLHVKIFKGKPRRSALKAVKQLTGVKLCSRCDGFGGWFVSRQDGHHVWFPCVHCNERGYIEVPETAV